MIHMLPSVGQMRKKKVIDDFVTAIALSLVNIVTGHAHASKHFARVLHHV